MKRMGNEQYQRAVIQRMLGQRSAGDNVIARTVGFTPASPTGPVIQADIGGNRVVQIDGGGQGIHPGVAANLARAENNAVMEAQALAPKRYQPTESSSSIVYDPTDMPMR